MTRPNTSAAAITALRAASGRVVWFAELLFDSGALRLHTNLGPITWNALTWSGAGDLASIGGIEENFDLNPTRLDLGLSGVPASVINIALTESYTNRGVKVWLGALDESGVLVVDPLLMFAGRMMNMSVELAGENGDAIQVTCESSLAIGDRSPGKRWTEGELQSQYAGDLGLAYLAKVVNAKVLWRGNRNALIGGGITPVSIKTVFNGTAGQRYGGG